MDNEKQHLSILLIEDSKINAYIIKATLNKYMPYPCHITHAEDMSTAKGILQNERSINLILLDLGLPDTDGGTDTFRKIEHVKDTIPIIILTSEQDHDLAVQMVDNGAEDYVQKSKMAKDPELLCDAIDFAVCRHKHLTEFQAQKNHDLEEKDMVIQWITGSYSITK